MNKFSDIELNESELAGRTLEYIYSLENTYRECTLYINILNPLENYGSLKNNENYIKERLSKLQFNIDYNDVTFKNIIEGFGDDTFEQIRKLGNKRFAIENFSKEIFWADNKEEKSYQCIANFNCFEERVISRDKISKTVINVPFNLDGWVKYYKNLVNFRFLEFSEELILGKSIIRFRHFKHDLFLGIETDYNKFKNNLKKDFNAEPDHKLIIFKKTDNKKIHRILIFDKFVNPHFNPPAYSFGWYFYAKNTIEIGENELGAQYIVEKSPLENGDLSLSMSEEFGEHLKRHVYFYYEMLYHTTKEYIKFIEHSIEIFMDENYC